MGANNEDLARTVLRREVKNHLAYTQWILAFFQILCLILFMSKGGSQLIPDNMMSDTGSGVDAYNLYTGIMIMMLFGFGYLMTFMQTYGLGAVGFTLLVSAIGLQWGLFVEAFFYQMVNRSFGPIPLDMYSIMNVTINIGAPLISFGAVIGKITPFQLVLMTFIEFACHSFCNNVLLIGMLRISDIGSTYNVHMFGSYYGLAVSYCLGKPATEPSGGHTPDIFSLLGTVMLWIFWPSFVGGYLPVNSVQQQRAFSNTIFALCASTVAAFWGSSFFNSATSKFRPVDIQNATLSGAVAIGAVANLSMNASGSIFIGTIAGLLSSFGYARLQPMLLNRFGLHDTCGVHNLHGIPAVFGGLVSFMMAARTRSGGEAYAHKDNSAQAAVQLFGILICMGFAIGTGAITGVVLRSFNISNTSDHKKFHDDQWWELAETGDHDAVNAESFNDDEAEEGGATTGVSPFHVDAPVGTQDKNDAFFSTL